MALCLLCLGLILLGALKMQAQESLHTSTPTAPLNKFPLQPDFQYKEFQGKWYSIGYANSIFWQTSHNTSTLQSTFYKLNDDRTFNVSSAWLRNGTCGWNYDVILPTDRPGAFSLQNMTAYEGLQNFTLKVLETDYKQYAIVYLKMNIHRTLYFEYILYGRNKNLSSEMKEHYNVAAGSLGVPYGHITFIDHHVDCSVQ